MALRRATTEAEVLAVLSNAKAFTRRLDISYEDLIELLRTRFINPNGTLIPRLERLRVPLATLRDLKDGAITDEQFDDAIAQRLDAAQYGGDIKGLGEESDELRQDHEPGRAGRPDRREKRVQFRSA